MWIIGMVLCMGLMLAGHGLARNAGQGSASHGHAASRAVDAAAPGGGADEPTPGAPLPEPGGVREARRVPGAELSQAEAASGSRSPPRAARAAGEAAPARAEGCGGRGGRDSLEGGGDDVRDRDDSSARARAGGGACDQDRLRLDAWPRSVVDGPGVAPAPAPDDVAAEDGAAHPWAPLHAGP
jgi:hypothetical protein